MSDKRIAHRTWLRFVVPSVLMVVGIALSKSGLNPLFGATFHELQTLGFGLFTLGSFSFLLLLQNARNPVLQDNLGEQIRIAEVLTAYGGILTYIQFQSVLEFTTLVLTVSIILVVGTAFAVLSDAADLYRGEVVPDYYKL